MTQWIETTKTLQNGEPVTRAIEIEPMDREIYLTDNAYAEVTDEVADLLANNISSILKVSEPDSPGSYFGDAGENVKVQVVAPDDTFEDLTVIGNASAESVSTEQQSFTEFDIVVTPNSHDFDDVVSELNAGQAVYAMPGSYGGENTRKEITDGSLTMADGAMIDVTDEPLSRWIDLKGSTGTPVDITSDVSVGQTSISVSDTEGFSSGDPAIITDDGGYLSMSGRGETVFVEKVVDATTLDLREGADLSHSTTDTITIKPVDPLTERNSWRNVTVDLRGSDQTVNDWPLIYRRFVDSHAFIDLTFLNGEGSKAHQYLEDRDSWNPKIIRGRSGRVEDGDLGLFYSPEGRTKHALVRDCFVHHGQVCQFGGNGQGPAIDPVFDTVVGVGSSFASSTTEIRPEFRNCVMANPSGDYQSENRAYIVQGYAPKFVDCKAINATIGWNIGGAGAELVDCKSRNVSEPLKLGAPSNDRPDSGELPIIARGCRFEGWDILSNIRDNIEAVELIECRMEGNDGSRWIAGSSEPQNTRVDGGKLVGGSTSFPLPRLHVSGLEYDGRGGTFLRATSEAVNEDLVFEDSEFYNISGGEAIRVENYDHLRLSNCRVPTNEPQCELWLVREEGGSGDKTLVLRGNDARNTDPEGGNGYDLVTTPISDGTNLTNDGTTI